MDSLFILNASGAPVLEKHWCDDRAVRRAALVVVPAFARYLGSVAALSDAEPVWGAPHETVCVHIQRKELIFLAIVSREVPPLEVLEVLEGVVQALGEYIGRLSELTIKENFVTVYQLLSEMVDSGATVTTDTAVLRGLVPVPSLVSRVIENVSGIGIGPERRPNVNTSSTPWRAQGIRHASNEFFVDVVERIDAVLDSGGSVVSYDVSGDISCKSQLTGMPDLTMVLNRPEIMDDVTFHPCVRRRAWDAERTIGFVPPDGQFKLASFHVAMDASPRSLPLNVRAQSARSDGVHSVDIAVDPGQCNGRPVEKVCVRVPLPQQAYNIGVQCKSGTHTVATARAPQVEWTVKSMRPGDRGLRLRITYLLRDSGNSSGNGGGAAAPPGVAAAFVDFEVAGYSASSIKVDALRLHRESYKLFKGVRYVTQSGSFQVRL
ncbi:AP-3 complex subunit mu-2 [Coemansia javaensis]|uniref:AP-3 complex subunit mu-2 n=1 Tax=Coemansia javaensis TaxID=2761396 RepID=A0A9W8HKB6_9FUNG|nr:AP-3 complex subunit mu-2 [Coemansia javaensis]